jgi:hypothetical protein
MMGKSSGTMQRASTMHALAGIGGSDDVQHASTAHMIGDATRIVLVSERSAAMIVSQNPC